MAQAVAHGSELADGSVEFVGLGREHLPVDARYASRREHVADLFERKARGAADRNKRQPLEHAGVEQAAQAAPAGGGDEPFFFVEAQRRCWNA